MSLTDDYTMKYRGAQPLRHLCTLQNCDFVLYMCAKELAANKGTSAQQQCDQSAVFGYQTSSEILYCVGLLIVVA